MFVPDIGLNTDDKRRNKKDKSWLSCTLNFMEKKGV